MLVLLGQQDENLKALLKTVTNKRDAIVASNIAEIEKLTSDEEKLLRTINQTEKMRLDLLAGYAKGNSSEINSFNIDEYVLAISGELDIRQQKEFSNLRSEIKDTTKKIMQANDQVKYIILQSRSLMSDIVSAIFKDRTKSLLDVKA